MDYESQQRVMAASGGGDLENVTNEATLMEDARSIGFRGHGCFSRRRARARYPDKY